MLPPCVPSLPLCKFRLAYSTRARALRPSSAANAADLFLVRVATLAVERVDGRALSPPLAFPFPRDGEDEEGKGALRGDGIGKGITTESGLIPVPIPVNVELEVGGGAGAGSNGAKYEHASSPDSDVGEKGENDVNDASLAEKEVKDDPVGENDNTEGALAVGLCHAPIPADMGDGEVGEVGDKKDDDVE